VAAQLKQDLGIDADLVVGNSGELSVWVDGEKVVEKTRAKFPDPGDVVAAVRARTP
jgi:predicted acyltransferase (DUF342 family)